MSFSVISDVAPFLKRLLISIFLEIRLALSKKDALEFRSVTFSTNAYLAPLSLRIMMGM